MITIRRGDARGVTSLPWLESRHTFSFGDYHDPAHMRFGPLRVLNEDWVTPGRGFATHPHRDMEILTWVIAGELAHRDSLGTGSVIRPGDAQLMTAGTGIRHSEVEPTGLEPVHLLQVWIEPSRGDLAPGYQQLALDDGRMRNRWCIVADAGGHGGGLILHQDATVLVARLDAGVTLDHVPGAGRSTWMQVVRGDVRVGGAALSAGDGAADPDAAPWRVAATTDAEVLVFVLQSVA